MPIPETEFTCLKVDWHSDENPYITFYSYRKLISPQVLIYSGQRITRESVGRVSLN